MTIKEYLKTLDKKELIQLEPNIGLRSFNGNAELLHFLGTVEEVLNLDPPHIQAEYEGNVPTCIVNGNEGKYMIYQDLKKTEIEKYSLDEKIKEINLDDWNKITLPTDISF